jgi:(p)ppGpp synthase/HD superfamily hydrolase
MFEATESLRMATETAVFAHRLQFRKNGVTPYIVHPANVAQLVSIYDPGNYNAMIVAWFHDVLEDCGQEGRELFGAFIIDAPMHHTDKTIIYNAVEALTKNDNIVGRTPKWEDCIHRLFDSNTPRIARIVKICDRMDNLMDMNGFTDGFKRIYHTETDMLLEAFINEKTHGHMMTNEMAAFRDLERISNKVFSNL